jgi:hypothetical protein
MEPTLLARSRVPASAAHLQRYAVEHLITNPDQSTGSVFVREEKESPMRTLSARTLAVLPVVLMFLPFGGVADNSAWADPFQIRIVDRETGEGIARVRLTSDNGVVCYTRGDGSVAWTEAALMDRDVSFRIETASAQRTVTVWVSPGGHAEVAVAQ